jgi:hypothetical protein
VLTENYYFPNFGQQTQPQQEFTVPASGINANNNIFFMAVSATSITASNFQFGSFWIADPFNGFQVVDLSHSLISGVTVDSSTNMSGFNSSRVSFSSNSVTVNWEGLSFTNSTVVKLDLTFDPPLDPSQVNIAQTLNGSASPAGNSGTLAVADGTGLALAGVIDNSGTMAVNGVTAATAVEINGNVTLQGGGQIQLSESNENYILGSDGSATLTNLDNTISGSGDIGNGSLNFSNAGVIETQGSYALLIDTGAKAFVNTGTLETDGGSLIVKSAVTGGGSAVIVGGTLEFAGAADNNVSFSGSNMGVLALDQSQGFAGTVAGFGSQDQIDLGDIGFSANTTLGYAPNGENSGGTLTLNDGTNTASIALLGQYMASSFATASDGHGGTLITDPPAVAQNQLTQSHG